MARCMPQGMFPAALVFLRAIPDKIEHPIRWRWQRPQRRSRHVCQDCLRIPLARPDHAHGSPVFKRGRQVRREPLERAFAWIADQGDQQPAEDQKVLGLGTAEMPLERVEYLIYLARDACATPQVSRSCAFWDVGCIQNTQERSYFQVFSGDTPALRPATRHF